MYGKLYENDKVHINRTNYIYYKLSSQSTPHSVKDKLVLILYDYNTCTILYEAYAQAKASMAKNTMPNTSNFEPTCISPIRQCSASAPEIKNLWND
ncbi:hypothetical protein RhiirA4_458495 [Rhizophagus irregularis]|uniref:Uncharacterized protein n=1 Tax=Rhizophagus irregularis TaxID=588596 RepID=A0A2I1GCB3_9GLOM|nr:hypothetical protein RhiirA4_458495 [Rhizophagus irregularis]